MFQFLCYVTFWKSFHSGSKIFSSDTDPGAAGAAAAASDATTAKAVIKTEAAAEAAAGPAAAGSVSEYKFVDPERKDFQKVT